MRRGLYRIGGGGKMASQVPLSRSRGRIVAARGRREGAKMTAVTLNDSQARSRWAPIVAASIGNALEWFDFVVYGFFALTISKLFFPAGDQAVSLLLTFGTFGIPFVIRPFGAIVLGDYADRHGRKATLILTIGLMMLGTAM